MGDRALREGYVLVVPGARGWNAKVELFAADRRKATLLLWTALFMAFATLYFLTMWIPR